MSTFDLTRTLGVLDGAGLHHIQAFVLAVFDGRHAKGGAGQFGVFYFFDALVTHLRQSAFERFGLGRGNGLDDAEQAFGVGAIGLALFAVSGLQRKGGTSCTPVGI